MNLPHEVIKGPMLPYSVCGSSLLDTVPTHEPIAVAGKWDTDELSLGPIATGGGEGFWSMLSRHEQALL